MDKRRAHVWISGRVHGVAFRAYTQEAAYHLGIGGWVRNLPDGRVEAVFEGDADKVARMVEWCRKGSPMSRVTEVEVREEDFRGEFVRFEITFGRWGA
ncbi:acylphosphatase [Syntrophobacter fumaroxidans]|uniref:Acylphosphatase n=1 Tax=Syntrophobacter fumaroxidans (strain DSM 10017 / MPOB) TaxID=335543 RepID=ACYP_SYNFM|nr:acylphosphatase [Syntrophobacter fumaroxidans]A0LI66.1 RecName: Full=Acylphosphatase; AltName: Full=Acylphosphate phosphohydrolase [Syntrophobacter fumaroxidans MPOB]ABK17118.1 acylphosphatase [Syntrophobacter fumaroxidans MPOB]HOI96380.1 acylphosphatase [Syntrophobacter fumaroxidans]